MSSTSDIGVMPLARSLRRRRRKLSLSPYRKHALISVHDTPTTAIQPFATSNPAPAGEFRISFGNTSDSATGNESTQARNRTALDKVLFYPFDPPR